jgi:hypothetical protein
MSVVTGSDERYRARMIGAIRVPVNSFVQLRRRTQGQGPQESGARKSGDDQATAIDYARTRIHLRSSVSLQLSLIKIF